MEYTSLVSGKKRESKDVTGCEAYKKTKHESSVLDSHVGHVDKCILLKRHVFLWLGEPLLPSLLLFTRLYFQYPRKVCTYIRVSKRKEPTKKRMPPRPRIFGYPLFLFAVPRFFYLVARSVSVRASSLRLPLVHTTNKYTTPVVSLVAMAAAFALWVASCASLYAQLPEHDALGGVLEAFPDQPPTLQANVIVSAVLGVLLLLKVREGTRQREKPAANRCVQ